jgi:hypothetical protein
LDIVVLEFASWAFFVFDGDGLTVVEFDYIGFARKTVAVGVEGQSAKHRYIARSFVTGRVGMIVE